MTVYIAEEFTPDEADILRRYFTNLDGPVFALVNLPEVVKGALFARYSRSSKSLRRLFLDEFVGDLDISGDATIDATVGLRRAEELYDRVFFEYGDDSVAQLGGVHLACEQASNLLTKVLEWGRLMAYLEQSTRYIAYDTRLGGRYRYYRDPEVLGSAARPRYVGDMDRLFDTYAELVPVMADFFRERFPKDAGRLRLRLPPGDPGQGVRRRAGRAAGGVAVERRHLRHRPGLRGAAAADAVAPAARGPRLRRPHAHRAPQGDPELPQAGRPRRPGRGVEHLPRRPPARRWRRSPAGSSRPTATPDDGPDGAAASTATPTARSSSSRRCSTRTRHVPEAQIEQRVRAMTAEERLAVVRAYVGERANRRHKPGRALERLAYRFDVLADYGAFRDLQRHRMLTIEWQALTPAPRLHPARGGRPGRAPPSASTRPWSARRRSTTRWPSGSRPRPPTPCRWPTRCASTSTSTPGRRCTSSSCAPRPQGHPAYRRGRPGDAPPHRRAGRPPRRGRGDALRRPLARAEPRAPRRRAPGRGAAASCAG